MNTLIKNTKILMPDFTVLAKGEIFIENNIIKYVGEKYKGDLEINTIIDAENNISIPGFVNGHSHSAMSLLRNTSDSKNLQDWLFEDIIPREKKLNRNDVYLGTILAIAEYLKTGITTFCDLYFHANDIARAINDTGIRGCVGIGFHPDDTRTSKDIEIEHNQVNNISDRITTCFYAHSLYACDFSQYDIILSFSKKYKRPVQTHASETLLEVGEITKKNNDKTPIQVLEDIGFFDNKSMIAHAVHVDSKDIEILRKHKVSVITNPSSNLKLGSGIAPINKMLNEDINIGIGTDGAASNNSYNFFKEMYLTSVLQKGIMNDASAVSSKQSIKMATENMAKALGLNDIGLIKKGYKADIITINLQDVNMVPTNNILSAIVYSADPSNIKMTMVDGRVLYKNGEYFINKDINDIIRRVKKYEKESNNNE